MEESVVSEETSREQKPRPRRMAHAVRARSPARYGHQFAVTNDMPRGGTRMLQACAPGAARMLSRRVACVCGVGPRVACCLSPCAHREEVEVSAGMLAGSGR